MLKRILRISAIILGVIVLLGAGFIGYLTAVEYKPAAVEKLEIQFPGEATKSLAVGDSFEIITFNIGYGALSSGEDFFMDGGTTVRPESPDLIEENLKGIAGILNDYSPDVILFQEIDRNSHRSHYIDEFERLNSLLEGYSSIFANNFKCEFVPIPIPPIQKVDSGGAIFSKFVTQHAERIAQPGSFSWPVRIANFKRCLTVERVPLSDTDRELVLICAHLDAYDDGEGRIAQTQHLMNYIYTEYAKGNYVILGGDFNQSFPGSPFEITDEGIWTARNLSDVELEPGWRFASDTVNATCRLLNEPYDTAVSPYLYIIDGFLVSPNLTVETVRTVDEAGFLYSDHNPVYMKLTLN